ncbi:hypothetical protein PCYB_001740 [Plasmodium cynomolgi strain B]|uniref:Methyltransferase n=1 Tax=Plasmodium cynomolgi (strain B) TaxID=1120755 RepID=K6UF38_PLACD|nr:hypothetical protein PCYB_001740 [Plasmodium cynomolgi strain B]GAB69426.1 hypothetical protein PCYB_001740 [Plasmodium cynomolgi strain B]
MWGKQIRLYKETNKIDLLKKNEFGKSILSESFNAQDGNILHLVLSHPMSNVREEQGGREVSGMRGGMCSSVGKCVDSASNSHKDTSFTTNLEDAKIIQECTHELLINVKVKVKKGESEEGVIIRIKKIVLNYFVNSFEDGKTSGEEVHSHNDITGINILECCLLISKWISEFFLQNSTPFRNKVLLEHDAWTGLSSISIFAHTNIFRNGTNQGPNQVFITNVNLFTLKQIVTYDYIIGSDLIYDKKNVTSLIDSIKLTLKTNGTFLYVCRKNRDDSQEFFDQLKKGNNNIQLFIPQSH